MRKFIGAAAALLLILAGQDARAQGPPSPFTW